MSRAVVADSSEDKSRLAGNRGVAQLTRAASICPRAALGDGQAAAAAAAIDRQLLLRRTLKERCRRRGCMCSY